MAETLPVGVTVTTESVADAPVGVAEACAPEPLPSAPLSLAWVRDDIGRAVERTPLLGSQVLLGLTEGEADRQAVDQAPLSETVGEALASPPEESAEADAAPETGDAVSALLPENVALAITELAPESAEPVVFDKNLTSRQRLQVSMRITCAKWAHRKGRPLAEATVAIASAAARWAAKRMSLGASPPVWSTGHPTASYKSYSQDRLVAEQQRPGRDAVCLLGLGSVKA